MTKQFAEIGLTVLAFMFMSELPRETESRGVIPNCHHLSHSLWSYHNKSCLPQLLNPPRYSSLSCRYYSKNLPEKKSNMKTVKNRLFVTHDKIKLRRWPEPVRLLES